IQLIEVRVGFDEFFPAVDSALDIVLALEEDKSIIEKRLGMSWIDGQSLPEHGEGFIDVVRLKKSLPKIIPRLDILGVCNNRLLVPPGGFGKILLVRLHVSEFRQRRDILRVGLYLVFKLLQQGRIER